MREHKIKCRCGHTTHMMCVEWPPKVAYCVQCSIPMKLVAYDPKTERTSYSRIQDV
jgi:hypothetical protein